MRMHKVNFSMEPIFKKSRRQDRVVISTAPIIELKGIQAIMNSAFIVLAESKSLAPVMNYNTFQFNS